MAGPGWLAQPLLKRIARFADGGRIHQFLWRRSRAVGLREKGTVRQGAMRSRSEPGQVASAGFGPKRIAVTRGYPVATAHQHGRAALAVSPKG